MENTTTIASTTIDDSPRTFTETEGPGGMTVDETGAGPRVVFVHGGGACGGRAFPLQEPLAERYRLVMPHRPGYGKSPAHGREDFEVDAGLIAELLGSGAHLVGHSYGGVVALLAAAKRPEAVLSLTLVEPGATSIARGNPAVDAFEAAFHAAVARSAGADAEGRLRAVFGVVDPSARFPSPLPPPLLRAAERLMDMRWPMEATVPAEALRVASFPKLVITGGASPVFEAVGDALARAIEAERRIVPGGHAVQNEGEPFNAVLEAFLRRATAVTH